MDDIYGDLDNFDMGDTIKELQKENAKLTEHIQILTNNLDKTMKELENVKKANEILQQNISKLFNTAKNDFERKSRLIDELRQKYDDVVFKRNQGQNYKIPKRKPENQPVIEQPDTKKRKITNIEINRKNSTLKDIYKNDDNRRDKFNKLRDKGRRRSRSRSRERRRKSPIFRTNRNKSRIYSPDFRPKIVEPKVVPYETEQKELLSMLLNKKAVRSDSDSVVSIHSSSSLEDYITKTENKPKKIQIKNKSIKNCDRTINKDIKIVKSINKKEKSTTEKVKTTDEIEEGEISDDDCEILKESSQNKKNKKEKKDVRNKNKNKNCTNDKIKKEKNVDVKHEVTNEDWSNVSINEEASISILIEQSEKLKKHLNEIDANDTRTDNTIADNSEIKSDIPAKSNNDEVLKSETVLEKPIVHIKIDTVSVDSKEICKENISNNNAPESVEKKKPKRRRCVLLTD